MCTVAVDRQSKDLGSNPSAIESVFFSTERFSNSLNINNYIHKSGNNYSNKICINGSVM